MGDINYKKYFLRTLIVALAISAVIGIVIFLVGDFGETEIKLLFSTLAIGGFSLTGLSSSTIHNRTELKLFSVIGMFISVLAFLMTTITIWEVFDPSDMWQTVLIFVILSVSIAHISLLFQISPKTNKIKYALFGTIIFISIVALMLIKSTINEFEENEFYFRLLGVFAILDVLGTIATPILNRISEKKQ